MKIEKNTKPAKNVKSAKNVKPAEPAEPVKPAETAKPAKHGDPTKPAKNAKIAKIARSAKITRSAKRIGDVGKSSFQLYQENDMNVYAGYATLYVITAFFPCVMLIISVINMLPGYSPIDITEYLLRFLPDLYPVKNLVQTVVTNLKVQSNGLLASISALVTLWSASVGVSSLQRGLKKVFRRENSRVPDKVIALLFTMILVVLVPVMTIFTILGNILVELAKTVSEFFGAERIAESVTSVIQISNIGAMAAVVLLVLLTYAFLPGGKATLKTQLPGTIFTIVMWAAFTKLFSFFIPRFYHSSSIYGSLASLFLILMWLRIIIAIFYFGAVLNSTLCSQSIRVKDHSYTRST